jgi:flagellar hook-associated protein 3 FlgL
MRTTGISTVALSEALRTSIKRTQADLYKAQAEVGSGRFADTGLALGARSTQVVTLGRDIDRMKGIIDSNSLVTTRLKATQGALDQLSTAAQSFLSKLTISSSGTGNTTEVAKEAAQSVLSSLTSILNTNVNGEYIFAGISTDVRPVNDYTAAGSPAKAAFDAAFQSHFGFPQTDPAAASISTSDMDAFMTAVEPEFLGAGWSSTWSNATDQTISTRITLTETSDTSVSANQPAIQKLAMAATLVHDLFNSNVGGAGQKAILSKAISLVADVTSSLATLQGSTGIMQERVSNASERLQTQVNLFDKHLSGLVSVDPYEASTRVSNLLTQIETSYALTARIQQISILRYIS